MVHERTLKLVGASRSSNSLFKEPAWGELPAGFLCFLGKARSTMRLGKVRVSRVAVREKDRPGVVA